jgi:hypothetical protein
MPQAFRRQPPAWSDRRNAVDLPPFLPSLGARASRLCVGAPYCEQRRTTCPRSERSGICTLTRPSPPVLSTPHAPVAELVDAPDSKSGGLTPVLVRVRPGAPQQNQTVSGKRSSARRTAFGTDWGAVLRQCGCNRTHGWKDSAIRPEGNPCAMARSSKGNITEAAEMAEQDDVTTCGICSEPSRNGERAVQSRPGGCFSYVAPCSREILATPGGCFFHRQRNTGGLTRNLNRNSRDLAPHETAPFCLACSLPSSASTSFAGTSIFVFHRAS